MNIFQYTEKESVKQMRKFFAILGILFSCAILYVGLQYLNGNAQIVGGSAVSSPSSASSAPSYYDSGYASFGGDFYTYVNNNAAEASRAVRTVASNQIHLFDQMSRLTGILSRFFGFFLISLGGIGLCLFGCLCFTPKMTPAASPAPAIPAAPAAPEIHPEKHTPEPQKIKEEPKE